MPIEKETKKEAKTTLHGLGTASGIRSIMKLPTHAELLKLLCL